jgi:ribonuclease HI
MELSEHEIDFEERSAIKSQVLAYFIAESMEQSRYTEGTIIDMSW